MNTHPRVLKWSLIIGIMIVLNLFFNYALSLAYKTPNYEVFCPQEQVVIQPKTQNECTDKGGQWNENYYDKPVRADEAIPAGYCDTQFTCRQAHADAQRNYDKNIFIALVLLGALSVLIGNFFKGNEVISNGLALGGVLSFVVASMRYWTSANDLIRVIILAIALGLLFWIAIKKFKS